MHDESPEGQRWCEAHQSFHPIEEFYKVKAARYTGGYRYTCKVIAKERVAASRRNAAEGSRLREAIRKANRESIKRHPEANRARVAAHRKRKKNAASE